MNFKKGRSDEQNQPRFKKRDPNQDGSSSCKVKVEGGISSPGVKPTCASCGKKHFRKCLAGTCGYFGCGKKSHKVRDCPIITSRGREDKKIPPRAPEGDAPKMNHFYALRTKGADSDDDACKL